MSLLLSLILLLYHKTTTHTNSPKNVSLVRSNPQHRQIKQTDRQTARQTEQQAAEQVEIVLSCSRSCGSGVQQ